ncbi:hypothetical protein GW756_04870 [bacterium]|nr:hypothetical protein [bacterium]NCQ55710.1 hypothetical protein [Candidatus Parcubacteria bacterium]NCS67659.1 hypothetical protein [Candidatus Peregrinibacteria bacterium]NCS96673.1 hypothetical protein [bacterium]
MQKLILFGLLIIALSSATALGQSRLKTANSVNIKDGYIEETVVLVDDAGELYLEFIKDDRVAKSLDGQIYTGEILPPIQIDALAKAPRARMREVLSFEVISDTNEPLELIDQFTALQSKERLRFSLKNQAGQRSQGAQLISVFKAEDNVNDPALWKYYPENPKTPWKRLGGIKGETPAEEDQIFSAYLFSTGSYTIWDENPLPDFQPSFPNDEIELAEPSPFPSVVEEDELAIFDDEDFVNLLEGEDAQFEDDFSQTPLTGDTTTPNLVPAVGNPSQSNNGALVPAVAEDETSSSTMNQINTPQSQTQTSNFLLAPTTSSNSTVPAVPNQNEATSVSEIGLAQSLQANSFQNFGVDEGDLPEAGGFQFPWLILIVFGIAGFSVYAIRKKPY